MGYITRDSFAWLCEGDHGMCEKAWGAPPRSCNPLCAVSRPAGYGGGLPIGPRSLLRCPKPPRRRSRGCRFWPRCQPLLTVSQPWTLAPSCGVQNRPSAAFAAVGFDRGANPCSLFPALRALAGVAFCKGRANTSRGAHGDKIGMSVESSHWENGREKAALLNG